MHPSWKEASEIAQILESQRALRTRNSAYSPEHSPNGTPQFRHEIFGNLDNTIADLHRSQDTLHHIPEFHEAITDLIGFVKQVRSEAPVQSSAKTAFTRLQALRTWIFWLPTKLLHGGEGDLVALAVMAHFYSSALVLEPFFPSLEGSYLGCMTLGPIQNIDSILLSRKSSFPLSHITQLAASLMDAPRHNVNDYKSYIQYTTTTTHHMHSMNNHMIPTPPSPYHQFPADEFASSFVVAAAAASSSSAPYTPPAMLSSFPATTSSPFQQPSPSYRSSGSFSAFYSMSPS